MGLPNAGDVFPGFFIYGINPIGSSVQSAIPQQLLIHRSCLLSDELRLSMVDASLEIVVVLEWEELIVLQTRALGMVFSGFIYGLFGRGRLFVIHVF